MFFSTFAPIPLSLIALAAITDASPSLHRLALRDTMAYNVLDGQNFPDPSSITIGGVTYVFGTTTAGLNIAMTKNKNFDDSGTWDQTLEDPFPTDNVPAYSNWATADTTWAPDVSQLVRAYAAVPFPPRAFTEIKRPGASMLTRGFRFPIDRL